MPTDQFNLRIRAELAEAVRERAHDQRCKPRDVIEELIESAPWSAIAGTSTEHPELPFPLTDPAQRDDDPVPPSSGEPADQRAGDAETPRRRGRKDSADKGAEGAKSGQRRGQGAATPSEPAAPESRACPACADPMEYHQEADVWACSGCGHGELS